ncbi:MAG: response regulator transcription factor [Caldilineaceae bacterium]|nr:response regulator transcription factor [Caldilineaceae bacterium]MCB0121257.1 response regulator transcription factor [Caldilineaceae bacterium]
MQILLADDQLHLSGTMQLWLEQIPGFALAGVVTDVPALLSQVQSFHPDILLLDWKLAGLNDSERRQQLLGQLHHLVPTMRIVLLTTEPVSLRQAQKYQVDAFVSKSDSPDYLAQVLRRLREVITETHE